MKLSYSPSYATLQSIEQLQDRLSIGDQDLEPDELQLANEAAQRKRRDILHTQPAAHQSAKILTMLPRFPSSQGSGLAFRFR